jgi:hypothetical protein
MKLDLLKISNFGVIQLLNKDKFPIGKNWFFSDPGVLEKLWSRTSSLRTNTLLYASLSDANVTEIPLLYNLAF